MRIRSLAIVLLSAALLRADPPVELPPLLPQTVPAAPVPGPRGPVGEYDHGYLYLPEVAPASPPAQPPEDARPLGRWWLNPSIALGWATKDTPLPTMQLRVPGLRNGPVVPLEGVTADLFRVGMQFSGGWWCDDQRKNGIDGGFSLLGTSDRTVTGVAPGVVFLFPNGSTRAPQLVPFPEPIASTFYGTFPATYSSWFVSAEMNYRRSLVREPSFRLDALAGYRFGYVADEVYVGDVPTDGSDDYRRNRFSVANQFHGGQVGLAGEYRMDKWSVGGEAKVALGAVTTSVSESGLFTNPDVSNGSSFAALSHRCAGSRFAVLPTLTATLGRKCGEFSRVYVGYSFQYLNNLVRLGDVLDPTTNGGPVRVTDFTVQAVKIGWEWRY